MSHQTNSRWPSAPRSSSCFSYTLHTCVGTDPRSIVYRIRRFIRSGTQVASGAHTITTTIESLQLSILRGASSVVLTRIYNTLSYWYQQLLSTLRKVYFNK